MRSIFVNPSEAVASANGTIASLVATGLNEAKASDKSFNCKVTRDAAGKITGAKSTSTGWLTETEIEFS